MNSAVSPKIFRQTIYMQSRNDYLLSEAKIARSRAIFTLRLPSRCHRQRFGGHVLYDFLYCQVVLALWIRKLVHVEMRTREGILCCCVGQVQATRTFIDRTLLAYACQRCLLGVGYPFENGREAYLSLFPTHDRSNIACFHLPKASHFGSRRPSPRLAEFINDVLQKFISRLQDMQCLWLYLLALVLRQSSFEHLALAETHCSSKLCAKEYKTSCGIEYAGPLFGVKASIE